MRFLITLLVLICFIAQDISAQDMPLAQDQPEIYDLVIYELLVRDFVSVHNYQTLIDTLDYLSNLGINAI